MTRVCNIIPVTPANAELQLIHLKCKMASPSFWWKDSVCELNWPFLKKTLMLLLGPVLAPSLSSLRPHFPSIYVRMNSLNTDFLHVQKIISKHTTSKKPAHDLSWPTFWDTHFLIIFQICFIHLECEFCMVCICACVRVCMCVCMCVQRKKMNQGFKLDHSTDLWV